MPEGDTVAWTAARLHRALAGQVLTGCELRWPSLATRDLTGSTTLEVVAAGKHLLHRLDSGVTLHSHLRMDGTWRIRPPDEPISRHHLIRAVLQTQRATAIGRALGMLDLVPTSQEHLLVGHLGPDILADGFDAAHVAGRVGGRRELEGQDVHGAIESGGTGEELGHVVTQDAIPDRAARLGDDPADHRERHPAAGQAAGPLSERRPLALVLLDQQVLAGLGTFWVSEALFALQVHPWRASADVPTPQVERVLDWARRRMLVSARTGIQTATGHHQEGSLGAVHARSGRPCRRCGQGVRVALVGDAPRERTIFYCPACQGGLAPGDDGRPQAPLGARRRRTTR